MTLLITSLVEKLLIPATWPPCSCSEYIGVGFILPALEISITLAGIKKTPMITVAITINLNRDTSM